jgi:hypothetical protein
MPSLKKVINGWIDEIPDDKLTGFGNNIRTIYSDDNLRLDMQGVSDPSYTTE